MFVDDLSRRERMLLFALFLLAFATHMSHIAITLVLLGLSALVRWKWKVFASVTRPWRTFAMILLLAVVGTLAMGVSLAKSKNTFFAGRMAETGILQLFLEEHCANEHYLLCQRLGSIPRSAIDFVWAKDTPLNVYTSRQEMEHELGRIARSSFTEPALLKIYLKTTLSYSAQQLTCFAVGDGNGDFHKGTLLHERVGLFIPSELGAFDDAKQMHPAAFRGPLPLLNRLHVWIMIASLLSIVVLSFAYRSAFGNVPKARLLTLFLFIALVVADSINASLVMVEDRFGLKLSWTVPFIAFALLARAMQRAGSLNPADGS